MLCVVQGWAEAVKGCSYVIHVASPVVAVPPKDESVIIDPAVQVVYAYLYGVYTNINIWTPWCSQRAPWWSCVGACECDGAGWWW
jgi:hypothetical protein